MKIFVLLKQVPDTETKIQINSDKTAIESANIKWIVSPYDEFAIEEALKTKEANSGSTVTAITLGPDRATEALRTALAMGADEAIHVKVDEPLDTCRVGMALAEALKKEAPDLIFAGKQAIDDDQCATFNYVAELMDVPSASVVINVELAGDKQSVKVEREVEGGSKHVIEIPTPCLVAVNKGINTPRYASLPGIMKAKRKPIKAVSLSELGLDSQSARVQESEYALPPERSAGKKLDGEPVQQVAELVRLLREEAKVI